MSRTVVKPKKSGLATFAMYSGGVTLIWLWLAAGAVMADQISFWIIVPISLAGAICFGWICWWALRTRGVDEPALIIDEVGVFDNVSIVRAGRVKWREMERIWVSGPKWMQFLCVMPDNVGTYCAQQEEVRGTIMRLNRGLLGAPIVVPLCILDMPEDEIWEHISKIAPGGAPKSTPANLATGA